ncbi:outer membrane protein [Chlorobium phaeovibrioides]|nr:outer membrane protein [Chlorobium phaeovibrioides]
MKKIVMTLMAAGLIAAPSLASAETTPYVSLSAGIGMMNNSDVDLESGAIWSASDHDVEYDSGYALEGAFGVKKDMFRAELAIGYQVQDANKVFDTKWDGLEVSLLSFMANGYADFKMDGGISPYLMGGLGFATVDVSDSSVSADVTPFAWQLGAGVGVPATDNITVDLGYRYFSTADVDIDSTVYDSIGFSTSKILLGMRYSF